MIKQKIFTSRKRCVRCGSPIIYGGRGPYPKYCSICKKKRKSEIDSNFFKKKQQRINKIAKEIDKYPMRYDDYGAPYIDQTHAGFDSIINDKIFIKFLGSSETTKWALDQREYQLRKKHGLLKK